MAGVRRIFANSVLVLEVLRNFQPNVQSVPIADSSYRLKRFASSVAVTRCRERKMPLSSKYVVETEYLLCNLRSSISSNK